MLVTLSITDTWLVDIATPTGIVLVGDEKDNQCVAYHVKVACAFYQSAMVKVRTLTPKLAGPLESLVRGALAGYGCQADRQQ